MIGKKLSFGEKYPNLIPEWSKKNEKTPFEYTFASGKTVWWHCLDCNSEYDMSIYLRHSGCNCPFCAGQRVNETNCMWTTHPEVAKLLTNSDIGYKIMSYSGKKADFTCPECGFVNNKIIQNVTKRGLQCKRCSDHISYPEKFLFRLFEQINVEFETQKVFEWSKNVESGNRKLNGKKKYDFYIPSINCIVETHGEQHYHKKTNPFKRTLSEEQENDILKESIAVDNGIKHYIVVNCEVSNPTHIKNNIFKSKLSNMFNLSEVNWLQCHEFASNSSFIKMACDLWNNGIKSTIQIGSKLKIDKSTVRIYLKQGKLLGWTDYDAEKAAKKTRKSNLIKINEINRVKIVQLTEEGKLIREWNSIEEAKNHYKINNISAVLNGRQTTSGGFRWFYKTDYDDLIKVNGELTFDVKPRVIQLTLDREFVAEHKSIGKATVAVGKNSKYHSAIKTCCENNNRTAFGFRWMYKSDYDELIKNKQLVLTT